MREIVTALTLGLANIGTASAIGLVVILAELKLEDETDESSKHCEFSAVSKQTGKKYWVETKMRSVSGLLGKTDVDGGTPSSKPTSQLSKHLRDLKHFNR
ncbi:MAG: hypothetical protein IH856_25215 [Deltaproteobacteria bacterium]|nr:hypothetical protein [Deltaproteobacteria bacterium]